MTFWRISLCKHYQNWYSSKWYRQETEPASPGWADHCFVMKINNPPKLPRARRLNVIVKSNKRGTLEQHWNDFRKFILNLRYVEAISCQLHLKHPTLKPKSPPSPAHPVNILDSHHFRPDKDVSPFIQRLFPVTWPLTQQPFPPFLSSPLRQNSVF